MEIDWNKVTVAFLEYARKKALESHQEILDRVHKLIDTAPTRREMDMVWEKYYDVCKYLHDASLEKKYSDKPYYRLKPEVHKKGGGRLDYFLTQDKTIGRLILRRAYREYYGKGIRCSHCHRIFIPLHDGRKAKYCSDSCRTMAYRKRKLRKRFEMLTKQHFSTEGDTHGNP